jgi:hypothetical protein
LTSPTYARDYNEVKNVGGKVSTTRTDDQTQIARFWFEGPGNWNTIARTVATTRRLDARDSARVLALMNIAMADAYIAGFKIRYVYDSWRPVTAIREGDNDGNDATVGDPTWDSHQNTPSVSDYPSTQSTFSAAAAVALASALGGDQASFTVTSGSHSTESPDRSRASPTRRGRAPTPESMPASTSEAPVRTGSSWAARSDSGPPRSISSREEVKPGRETAGRLAGSARRPAAPTPWSSTSGGKRHVLPRHDAQGSVPRPAIAWAA